MPTPTYGHETEQAQGLEELHVNGWIFRCQSSSACLSPIERNELAKTLHMDHIPLPEMLFGHNFLEVQHAETGFVYVLIHKMHFMNGHLSMIIQQKYKLTSRPMIIVTPRNIWAPSYPGRITKRSDR